MKFNHLTCIKFAYKQKGKTYWLCKCDCGVEKNLRVARLVDGSIKSCGCYSQEHLGFVYGDEPAFRSVFANYKNGAKRRNLSFDLNQEEFRLITSSPCYYCGKSPDFSNKYRYRKKEYVYYYNGIDRINNKLGYELTNVVACCRNCNLMKGDITIELISSIHSLLFSPDSKPDYINELLNERSGKGEKFGPHQLIDTWE